MFKVGIYALTARAVNYVYSHLSRKHGVFRIIFVISARERRTVNIYRGSIPPRVRKSVAALVAVKSRFSDNLPHSVSQIFIESRGNDYFAGKARVALVMF